MVLRQKKTSQRPAYVSAVLSDIGLTHFFFVSNLEEKNAPCLVYHDFASQSRQPCSETKAGLSVLSRLLQVKLLSRVNNT